MSYVVSIPLHLLSPEVTATENNQQQEVKLIINFHFLPEVKSWLESHIDPVPTIYINRHDFEPPDYYIKVPTQELKTQFELTWL